jgi:hypothetical protein
LTLILFLILSRLHSWILLIPITLESKKCYYSRLTDEKVRHRLVHVWSYKAVGAGVRTHTQAIQHRICAVGIICHTVDNQPQVLRCSLVYCTPHSLHCFLWLWKPYLFCSFRLPDACVALCSCPPSLLCFTGSTHCMNLMDLKLRAGRCQWLTKATSAEASLASANLHKVAALGSLKNQPGARFFSATHTNRDLVHSLVYSFDIHIIMRTYWHAPLGTMLGTMATRHSPCLWGAHTVHTWRETQTQVIPMSRREQQKRKVYVRVLCNTAKGQKPVESSRKKCYPPADHSMCKGSTAGHPC